MRTLNEVLEDVKSDTTKIGVKPPKIQTLEDVKNTTFFSTSDIDNEVKNLAPVVESDLGNRISAGFDRGVQDIKNIPEQLQIYGGQALMSVGGFVDSGELVSRGRELIKSAYGELQADEKKFWESSIQLSDKDLDSFGYGLGQGIANYGSMLAIGYLSPVAGIALGTALEVGQKAEEKIGYHIEETGDTELNKYTSQKASKDTLYTAIYGAGSAIIEKKFGLGEQLKMVKMPIGDKLKYIFKTSLSEGGTETLQELYATGLDFAGGYIDSSKLPERFMGAVKEGAIGAVLGGGMGVATAINHRSQAKAILRDNLKNTVPEKDLDNVVNGVYESVSDNMETVIAQELIQSESLRNKHGAIYESIKSEVSKQIKDTGAFADVDEMKLSQYIESTAKMFADQVLGEANKRKVVIDEVIKDSEIVYQDGKLYLQGATKKTKLKRLKSKTPSLLQFIRSKGGVIDEGGKLKQMEASKQYIGLVNKNGIDLDTMGEALWEAGYFAERPTVSEVLDYIDDELRGVKHYPLGYVEQKGVSQAENEAMLDNAISEYAEVMEYDISKMSFEEKQQIYEQMQRNLYASEEPIVEGEEVVEDFGFTDNEFFQVADEMARLDDIYPEYKGKTININGQEKTVYNSTGERIAKSKEALENFYNWFGDSKVVDEQGRPLVVYHGTYADFDAFNKNMVSNYSAYSKNFYFTENKQRATDYGNKILSVYLKSDNLFDVELNLPTREDIEKINIILAKDGLKLEGDYGFDGMYMTGENFLNDLGVMTEQDYDYLLREIGYDGIKSKDEFIVFEPNQIKSTSNRGTYSEGENIYYQVKNLPKQKGKIKGSFDALTKSIKITSEADFSTYQHEFAHFWLDNIWNYVNSGMASEKYIKEFESIKKWLGVKGNYLTREQHEKFARAYEKYLYKGTYANSPMGSVFSEYENFIREVYDSIAEIDTRAGKKYKAIPKVVYDFFNSMTSGNLPYYGDIEEPEKEVKKEVKDVKEYIEEESKVLEENRANYNLKPVETDIKKSYLTAYFKMTGEEVEAGTTTHEYQEKRAMSFIESDLARADRIAEGKELLPDDILDTAFNIMYARVQKRLGNRDKYAKALLNASMELRRYGQEIEATKLAYQDEKESAYWINKVMTSKAEALADSNSLKLKDMNTKIEKTIKAGMKEGKSAKDIAKELREELGVTELFQEEVYPTEDTDIKSYNYIYKYVNEQLGLGMSMEEAETITRKADDMLASLENSMSKTGNPSVDFFVKQKDLENYANSLAPSSNARVIVSVVGRGNLLTSIKSPLTNIISNFFVGAYRGAVRRVNLGVANSIVSPELIKENKMYSWEIFKKTGYNVNNITSETPRNTILGEKLTHSEGEGNIRKLGRLYEEYIYKWSLGAGDVFFKDYAFTDYVALKATKLANGDVNKANALFKDASLIEPQTEEGKQIRQEAIDESLIATFQNKGAISEGALKARSSIDFGVGFGEIVAPFVKTPANIVSMGLKAGFGGVRAIASEIKRDVKAGKILKPTQENIDLVTQNGLGLLLASMLINAIDDDDYMPPYALATSKDKQLAKELNIPFNAVKIGNTWVSLDYLGALASPLVGLLQARREEGFLNNIYGYSKSAGVQALSIPAFGNISDLFEKVQNLVRKSGDEVMSETGQDLLEQAYARVVPSLVSDVAKALDPYERETQGNEFITKIPVLRETAPKKVSVTSGVAEELGSPIYDLLFGSRIKEQVTNDVADELQRLNNVGYGVSLTTVTRSGLLSSLDEDTKQKVREDFATEYSKNVSRLIKTPRYRRATDEDKQEMINKIRRSIVSSLKKRHLKKRKK